MSTRGESEWVRNLRAAGTCALRRKGEVQTFRATEVPVAERAPILAAYRDAAGRTVTTYFKQLPDAVNLPTFPARGAANQASLILEIHPHS